MSVAVLPCFTISSSYPGKVHSHAVRKSPASKSDIDLPKRDTFSCNDSRRLTQLLSQCAFKRQDTLLHVRDMLPKAQGVVGDLPPEWLIRIKQEDRDKSRKNIFLAFKQSMQKIRDACHGEIRPLRGINYALRSRSAMDGPEPEVPDGNLTRELRLAGVTDEIEPLKFTFVNEGCFGTVHRFVVNNKPYALKLFKQKVNDMAGSIDYHGSPVEQSRAVYIQANVPDNPFTRFYFGDLDSAYMVTEFVGDGSGLVVKKFQAPDLQPWGLEHGDLRKSDNIRQGKIVDYGGISVVPKKAPQKPKEDQEHKRA
jgi:hypothetical protein